MRLKHLVVTTACIAIFLGTANAQSWSSNTYGLYVNPTTGTTGNVGIGIASTNSNKVTIKANTTTQPGLRIYNSAGSTKLLQSANGGLSVGTATAAATDGLLVQGASKLIGEVTLSNGLTVGGNTTINGAVTMKNTATVYNGLTVNVGTSIYNSIRFTGANGRSAISAYGYKNWDALDFSAREYIFNSGNVGIGVSAPQAKLHVGGKILCTGEVGIGIASTNSNKVTIKANTTTQPGLRIYNSAGSTKLLQSANGGLSVGTATAAATDGLLVQGASKLIGEVTLNNGLTVGGNTTINGAVTMKNAATIYNGLTVNVGTSIYNSIRFTGANGRSAISAYGYNNWDALDFSAREYIFNSGNVGIGVSAPQAKLHVAGKILCTGEIEVAESLKAKEIETKDIKVEINNAADYVFDENYNLKSLSEVESFVNANKHLPGVPSAAEMAQNGVSVSEMSNLLLEKVEELTLHMIQLEKENKALKAEVELLKK